MAGLRDVLVIKRIYVEVADDGCRVLVDRLRARGSSVL